MFGDIFLILLSFRIKTVSLGHLSKSSNSVSRLNESAIVSRRSDQGTYVKLANLFSLSYRMIKFFVNEKVPFSILSIPFLLRVKVSNLLQSLNMTACISEIQFEDAYSFFRF